MTAMNGFMCEYCGSESAGGIGHCPNCGARVDVRAMSTASGWMEMPPVEDMTTLQLGQSSMQIEGELVPVADVDLRGDDWVYFNHHVLLWMNDTVKLSNLPLKGVGKRVFAGLPLIMVSARGPGHVAFSFDHAGELLPVTLAANEEIDVKEHHFLLASGNVAYDYQNSNVWFRTRNGDETETHYPIGRYIDRFVAVDRPGMVLLHAKGNAFTRRLGNGESVLVKPDALLFKDPSVAMRLHFETTNANTTWGRARTTGWRSVRFAWLHLTGPGRVAVQSVHGHMHGTAGTLVKGSDASARDW
jgi:uncharacterized protein (AIM24 family)